MTKVKAEVLNAVVGGKRKGEEVEINESHAKHLEKIGYVRVVGIAESPKKKPASSSAASKDKPKTKKATTEPKTKTKTKDK